MKTINVVAAIIVDSGRIFATQRGYGDFKDGWEFPGGKIEAGETPEEALVREIKEELNADIEVEELLHIVEFDYPKFHLSMQCYFCTLQSEGVELIEHEAAKWLSLEEINDVEWLPADIEVVNILKENNSWQFAN